MAGHDPLDHIDHPVTELLVALAAGVDVPRAMAHEALPGPAQHQLTQYRGRVRVLGQVAERLDLAEVLDDLDAQPMVGGDGLTGVVGPRQL